MHRDSVDGPRVGYVLKKYPRLSETFILNEILGLEALGVPLRVFSLRLPDEGRFHADVARVRADIDYLPEMRSAATYEAFRVLSELPGSVRDRLGRVLAFLDRLPESRRPGLLVQSAHLAQGVLRHRIDHLHAHFMTIAAHAAYVAHLLTDVPFSVTAHAKDIFRTTVDR